MALPVQVASNSVSVAATTNVKAFGSNVTAGNLLFLVIGNKSGNFASSVHDSQGNVWTNQDVQGTGSATAETWFTVAGSTGPCTVTVTYALAKVSDLIIAEYLASGGVPGVDQSIANQATVGTSLNSGNITTTVAKELLICWGYNGSRSTAWTDSQGFSNEISTSNPSGASVVLFDFGVSSIGTYSDTLTATSGVSGDSLVVGIDSFIHISIGSSPPALTCGNPPNGYVNSSYTHTFAATGGTPPFTYTISAGTLPPGLNLSSGGVLSGTPTAPGTFSFTVKATDSAASTATANCSIIVTAASAAPFLQLTQNPIARLQAMFDNTKSVSNLQLVNVGGTLYYISKQQYPFLSANELLTAYFADSTALNWTVGTSIATGPNSPGGGTSTGISMAVVGTKIYVSDTQPPLDGIGGLNFPLGIWTYDTVAKTWSGPSAAGPFAAFSQTGASAMVALNNGNLLVVYVQTKDAFVANNILSVVVYNPNTNTWGSPVTLANYGAAAGALLASPLSIIHDPVTDNTVLYFQPGSPNSTPNRTLQTMVLSNTGALLNAPSALYTGVSTFAINGSFGVPTFTADSPYNEQTAAMPFLDFNSGPTFGNLLMAYVDPRTFAQSVETAAFQSDLESPNTIQVYSQQNQGGWVALDFGGFLYLVYAVDNGNLNSASSQNFLFAKSRGHSSTWSGLQTIFTSALSREGLQPFKSVWNSSGGLAIVTNNWDPTNNPQSGTIAGLTSFILLGASQPPQPPVSNVNIPGGGGTQVVHGGCKPLNEFDYCLLREVAKWKRMKPLPVCSVPEDLWAVLPWEPEWGSLPALAVPFRHIQSIVTPAAVAGDQVVSQLIVPQGYDGLLAGVFWKYNGVNFIEGSGDIFWRIQVNMRFVKDLSNVGFTLGSSVTPMPMTEGQQLQSRQRISVVVNVPNLSGTIQVGTSTVTGGLFGFFWPKGVPGWTSR